MNSLHIIFLGIIFTLLTYLIVNNLVVKMELYEYCIIEFLVGLGMYLTTRTYLLFVK